MCVCVCVCVSVCVCQSPKCFNPYTQARGRDAPSEPLQLSLCRIKLGDMGLNALASCLQVGRPSLHLSDVVSFFAITFFVGVFTYFSSFACRGVFISALHVRSNDLTPACVPSLLSILLQVKSHTHDTNTRTYTHTKHTLSTQ